MKKDPEGEDSSDPDEELEKLIGRNNNLQVPVKQTKNKGGPQGRGGSDEESEEEKGTKKKKGESDEEEEEPEEGSRAHVFREDEEERKR